MCDFWSSHISTDVQKPDQSSLLVFCSQPIPPLPSPPSFHTTLFTISAARSIQIPCHAIDSFCAFCLVSPLLFTYSAGPKLVHPSPPFPPCLHVVDFVLHLAVYTREFFKILGFAWVAVGTFSLVQVPTLFFVFCHWFNFTLFLDSQSVLSEHWIVSIALSIFIAGRNLIFVDWFKYVSSGCMWIELYPTVSSFPLGSFRNELVTRFALSKLIKTFCLRELNPRLSRHHTNNSRHLVMLKYFHRDAHSQQIPH